MRRRPSGLLLSPPPGPRPPPRCPPGPRESAAGPEGTLTACPDSARVQPVREVRPRKGSARVQPAWRALNEATTQSPRRAVRTGGRPQTRLPRECGSYLRGCPGTAHQLDLRLSAASEGGVSPKGHSTQGRGSLHTSQTIPRLLGVTRDPARGRQTRRLASLSRWARHS